MNTLEVGNGYRDPCPGQPVVGLHGEAGQGKAEALHPRKRPKWGEIRSGRRPRGKGRGPGLTREAGSGFAR